MNLYHVVVNLWRPDFAGPDYITQRQEGRLLQINKKTDIKYSFFSIWV